MGCPSQDPQSGVCWPALRSVARPLGSPVERRTKHLQKCPQVSRRNSAGTAPSAFLSHFVSAYILSSGCFRNILHCRRWGVFSTNANTPISYSLIFAYVGSQSTFELKYTPVCFMGGGGGQIHGPLYLHGFLSSPKMPVQDKEFPCTSVDYKTGLVL